MSSRVFLNSINILAVGWNISQRTPTGSQQKHSLVFVGVEGEQLLLVLRDPLQARQHVVLLQDALLLLRGQNMTILLSVCGRKGRGSITHSDGALVGGPDV